MRLGDLDALRNEVDTWGCNDYDKYDFLEAIDNAPTVETKKIEHTAYKEGYVDGFNQGIKITERPTGEWYLSKIRWTDKVSVKSNGDIIDFNGRVVGHIDLENMKGGTE
jgi:hypothetical protein